jgi:hypothetical protein
MKRGRGMSKVNRRTVMSATAALSRNGTNWGGKGGCLGFLVNLFCEWPHLLTDGNDMGGRAAWWGGGGGAAGGVFSNVVALTFFFKQNRLK